MMQRQNDNARGGGVVMGVRKPEKTRRPASGIVQHDSHITSPPAVRADVTSAYEAFVLRATCSRYARLVGSRATSDVHLCASRQVTEQLFGAFNVLCTADVSEEDLGSHRSCDVSQVTPGNKAASRGQGRSRTLACPCSRPLLNSALPRACYSRPLDITSPNSLAAFFSPQLNMLLALLLLKIHQLHPQLGLPVQRHASSPNHLEGLNTPRVALRDIVRNPEHSSDKRGNPHNQDHAASCCKILSCRPAFVTNTWRPPIARVASAITSSVFSARASGTSSAGMQGLGKRKTPQYPLANIRETTPPGLEPGSPLWEPNALSRYANRGPIIPGNYRPKPLRNIAMMWKAVKGGGGGDPGGNPPAAASSGMISKLRKSESGLSGIRIRFVLVGGECRGGKTAHSMFKIPIDRLEQPVCSISKNSQTGRVIQDYVFIVWDKCTMAHFFFEAVDRTLQDLRNDGRSFGGTNITRCYSRDVRRRSCSMNKKISDIEAYPKATSKIKQRDWSRPQQPSVSADLSCCGDLNTKSKLGMNPRGVYNTTLANRNELQVE
ncbi:hypothetical protein PR048_000881 [Dryococelus australis]|uniref:ATP-dependent DNA helicase n=1 Tax=Dryococelus australis TaxID=614101 RepID=A0ABQ9IFT4_9NEOP|nr:hypothetical protein PR048_000881 [Dryococelus australis]